MELFKYIIIAIIQGITEPLPISSSGHMFLFKTILNTNMFNDLNYEIICNFGSFLAIFIIFRKEIFKLINSFFTYLFNSKKRKETKASFQYCIYLLISTIPVAITGLLLKDFVEDKLYKISILGFAFLITAFILYIVRNIKGQKDDFDITLKDAIIIGLFQAFTILPGISRSGTVLVACLLCKLSRKAALKYTFILYFPVSVGSMILGVNDLINNPNLNALLLPYGLGMIIACIITFFSYEWLSNWVKKGKLAYFSIYCLVLAAFIFIYFR
ncbi:MAG: undecaprenyl-diphosphate phosphatase [Firmicutes bacterium]|nr:undecaprenyl-diphosphate phosphatase [Bacillota bacterium]